MTTTYKDYPFLYDDNGNFIDENFNIDEIDDKDVLKSLKDRKCLNIPLDKMNVLLGLPIFELGWILYLGLKYCSRNVELPNYDEVEKEIEAKLAEEVKLAKETTVKEVIKDFKWLSLDLKLITISHIKTSIKQSHRRKGKTKPKMETQLQPNTKSKYPGGMKDLPGCG